MKRLFLSLFVTLGLLMLTTHCKKENTATSLKPYIEVIGANPTNWGLGVEYEDAGAKAFSITMEQDTVDISDRIEMFHDVDVEAEGTYTVTYNATDHDGVRAETKTRTVNVVITK